MPSGDDLEVADLIPLYDASTNKTRYASLQELNEWFALGGGGGSHAPAVWGGEMVYIVPALLDGTTVAPIPSLADKDFTLQRAGTPLVALLPDNSNAADAEFEVLDTGGFRLLQPGDSLVGSERFLLTIFSLISTSGGGTTVNNFIKGTKIVTTNLTLDPVNDVNKVIQFRGDTTYITCTIPDLIDMPVNTFYLLDASVGQNKPVTVNTTGGQYIYMNKSGWTTLHIMPGEMCWIYRDVDGFYVINDFGDHYKNLGNIQWAYKVGLNQTVLNGTEILRADYPRLFVEVQTFGSSYVSKATWETASVTVDSRTVLKPYRGCWHQGDGSTTFGKPDFLNSFVRGVKTESGSDTQRHLNKPGGFQDHTVKVADNVGGVKTTGSNTATTVDNSGGEIDIRNFYEASTGPETRGENIGMLPVCNA